MGEIADSIWDEGFKEAMDRDAVVVYAISQCLRPNKPCRIVRQSVEAGDDCELPFKCAVCGQEFDI